MPVETGDDTSSAVASSGQAGEANIPRPRHAPAWPGHPVAGCRAAQLDYRVEQEEAAAEPESGTGDTEQAAAPAEPGEGTQSEQPAGEPADGSAEQPAEEPAEQAAEEPAEPEQEPQFGVTRKAPTN